MKFLAMILVGTCCSSGMAIAAEHEFEYTSAGIIKRLTSGIQNTHQVKTRSLNNMLAPAKTRSITVVERKNGSTISKVISVDSSKQGGFVNLKIEFDVNATSLRHDSIPLIRELGEALSSPELKGKHFAIKGHTDADGDSDYNFNLSLERALSVKRYLITTFGLNSSNFKVLGYGESLPLVANSSEQNKQLNRRVEIERLD